MRKLTLLSNTIAGLFLLAFVLTGCSSDTEDAVNVSANRLATGVSGKSLLTQHSFDKIVFDIVYVEGHKPGQESIANFLSFVQSRCFKPEGVDYQLTAIPDQGKAIYNTQDILDLEEAHRTAYNQGSTIAVFILFANGASHRDSGNSVILGTAYRNTSFVIFEETISTYSSRYISTDKTVLESTVLNHEFCHLLGLVNLNDDLDSGHEDLENPHHCEVSDCLMNYRTDAGIDLSEVNLGGGIPALDSQCLADLQALGGK